MGCLVPMRGRLMLLTVAMVAMPTCFVFAAEEEPAAAEAHPLIYIQSTFENASPVYWEIDEEGQVNVFLLYDHQRGETNRAAGHWHFCVETRPGAELTLVLNNLSNIYNGRVGSPAKEESITLLSPDGRHWTAHDTELLEGDRLRFSFTTETGQMYVARMEPYRLSDLERFLDEIRDSPLVAITPIGKTVEGRELEIVRIGRESAPRRVLLRARAHPWESAGNWVVEGLVRRLLADDDEARAFLDRYCLYVQPMANKDGVARGWTRFNTLGIDLNRGWEKPIDAALAPESYALEQWIESEIAQGRKPDLMIDFHNDQGGRLHVTRSEDFAQSAYLAKMERLETLLREHTWFTEGATGGTSRTFSTIGGGLLTRYGIHACVHELNANWVAGVDDYPSAAHWRKYGHDLALVFYELLDEPKE